VKKTLAREFIQEKYGDQAAPGYRRVRINGEGYALRLLDVQATSEC